MSPPFAVWLLTALCAWESWAQCPTSQAWKNKSLHLDFTSIPNIFAFLFSKVLLLRVFRYFSETMLVQEYACSVVYFESTVWLRGGQGHVLRQSCRISQLSMTTWPILASWPVSKCRYSRLEHQDAQKFLVSFFCASVGASTCLVCSLGMVIFECCEGPSDALHHIHCASGPEGAAIGSGGLLSNTVPWQLQSSSLMAY